MIKHDFKNVIFYSGLVIIGVLYNKCLMQGIQVKFYINSNIKSIFIILLCITKI